MKSKELSMSRLGRACLLALILTTHIRMQVNAQRTVNINLDSVQVHGKLALYDVQLYEMAGKNPVAGILFQTTDTSVIVMIEDYSMSKNDDARFSYKEYTYKVIKRISLEANLTKEKQPDVVINGSRKLFTRNKPSLQLKSLVQ